MSAPTLSEALAVMERFGHVRSPYFRLARRRSADRIAVRVDERIRLADAERIPMIECLMLSLQKLVEPVFGVSMRQAVFRFVWAPPSYAAAYRDYFHGVVRFDAPHTELEMPAQWLALRCPFADPATYASSMRTLETLARRLDGDDHVAARVEQLIAAHPDGVLSLKQIATRTRLSPRTLIRRLRGAGTTYQELIDAHRQERARTLLANPDFTIAEVGHRLGYGDAANFGRACRRWFGMAPGEYRKRRRTR